MTDTLKSSLLEWRLWNVRFFCFFFFQETDSSVFFLVSLFVLLCLSCSSDSFFYFWIYVCLCVCFLSIWDTLRDLVPLVQFKKMKNIHRGVLLLVKLQTKASNFTESSTRPWIFFVAIFKLYKWYQNCAKQPK